MITATNHGHLSRSPTSTPSWLPRLANFASSTPPKHSKKDDSSESKGVSPRVHAVSYLGLDGGSDEEEEESVEDLLWSAQMDLIGHRKAPAISKLRQAVALGSSAACATLANLLSRSARTNSQSPTNTSNHSYRTGPAGRLASVDGLPEPESTVRDSLMAASLFARGLDLELCKPLEKVKSVRTGGRPQRIEMMGKKDGYFTDDYGSASEDEKAEGEVVSLERVLDLVVGLTDCYRFGIVTPPLDSAPGTDDLWQRGAKMAERALHHPAIAWSIPSAHRRTSLSTGSPTPSSSPVRSIPYAMRSRESDPSIRVASQSPRRTSAARSYAHPSTSISAVPASIPSSFNPSSPHQLPTNLKHRLTIRIHLFYLLALQKWPEDKAAAEEYWNEIVRTAAITGGQVGTKEGDEIVAKAAQRLKVICDPLPNEAWKTAKQRKNSLSPPAVVDTKALSRDAVEDFRREQMEEVERKALDELAASPPLPLAKSIPARSRWNPLDAVIPPSSSSTATKFGSRPSKFHFANESNEYPSPPATPRPSPPTTHSTVDPVPAIPLSPPRVRATRRRTGSVSSFQPPTLLRRVESSASISTLPPDFFSARARAVNGSNWQHPSTSTMGSSTTSRFAFPIEFDTPSSTTAVQPVPTIGSKWTRGLKERFGFASLRISTINPFKQEAVKGSKAIVALKGMLKRDDESAGPGMYWSETPEEEEVLEEGSDVERSPQSSASPLPSVPTSPLRAPLRPRGILRPARSFIDPTTSRGAPSCPRVTYTPPTPDRLTRLSLHPAPSRSVSAAHPKAVPVDSLLLDLERASRVGVRTVCRGCSKKGLNYPACPRCGTTYCSRPCRVSEEGGGDGERHVCPAGIV